MQLSKFSLITFCLIFSTHSYSMFSTKECLDQSFKVEVIHKDKRTFGMSKVKLQVEKNNCEVTVFHQKFKLLKNKWKIDVCREPIHIKSGMDGVEVLKKNGSCINKNSSNFCNALKNIKEVLQDDGLIFADGEKEKLDTDHGKIYCTYQLVSNYLSEGTVYSRYGNSRYGNSRYGNSRTETEPVQKPIDKVAPVENIYLNNSTTKPSPSVDPIPPENKIMEEGQGGTF